MEQADEASVVFRDDLWAERAATLPDSVG